jgi:RNA polymerase sigma-70 factor (ECF subfamily)
MDDNASDLLARVRSGDESALHEFFRQREARLLRMVELRIDPVLRRRLDPGDVMQEAWIEIARRVDEWRRQEALPLHVWMRLITGQSLQQLQRRHLATHKRDALREVPAPESRISVSAAGAADAFVASATSPSQAAARGELRARVLAALEELDELDREIVTLRHIEELTNQEIAAELGIDPKAASKRYTRALVRLRPALVALGTSDGPVSA